VVRFNSLLTAFYYKEGTTYMYLMQCLNVISSAPALALMIDEYQEIAEDAATTGDLYGYLFAREAAGHAQGELLKRHIYCVGSDIGQLSKHEGL
jgi:hypothetical protein